jgi:hypothetical protein
MKSFWLVLLCSWPWLARAQEPPTLKAVGAVPLPGIKGQLGHLAVDEQRERLFVAAPEHHTVEVLDLKAGKRARSLSGLNQPRALAFLAKPNLLFVSCRGDGRLRIFDCADFRMIKTLGALPEIDHLGYDPAANRLFVGYGDGALGVVDAMAGVHTSSIHLEGHPEAFQLETGTARLFVNVPSAQHVAVLHRHDKEVLRVWPLKHFSGNFAMALDEANERLFLGCRNPARLVILETRRGRIVAHLEIAGDPDGLFYDPKRKRLYLSCGEGFVDVVAQVTPDSYELMKRLQTAPGARTSLFSAELDRFYVAAPAQDSRLAEVHVFQPVD